MRCINSEEATLLLAPLHLKIGKWGQICDVSEDPYGSTEWSHYPVPKEGLALYVFSHKILHWLPNKAGQLLQIDYSTNLNKDEAFLISRLLFGREKLEFLTCSRTFLFQTIGEEAVQERLLLGNIVNQLTLFGHHFEIASIGGPKERYLSIQDGYVYFLSKDQLALAEAHEMMDGLKTSPFSMEDEVNSSAG